MAHNTSYNHVSCCPIDTEAEISKALTGDQSECYEQRSEAVATGRAGRHWGITEISIM